MTVTLRFQSTGAIPGKGEPMVMIGPSLTLGRGDENDVVLPDPDRLLSKRHCVVENHNGNVVVVDISTNGTFLNYGKVALGSTPTPLNGGDILLLGPYELLVEIAADQSRDPTANIADPLMDGPVSHGDAHAAPSAVDLLDGPGSGGDFLDDLLGGAGPQGPGGVQRDALGDDGLLPPLGEEDDLMPPVPAPESSRSGLGQRGAAVNDNFAAAGSGASMIPDDWDDDFLGGGADDPFAEPDLPTSATNDGAPATSASGAGAPAFIPDDDMLEDKPPQPADEAPPEPAASAPPSRPAALETPSETSPEPVQAGPQDAAAAQAFVNALGGGTLEIPDADLTPTLSRLGHVLRMMIHGMREILMTRTSIKSEFRIEQTMIRAGGNNPLKFSISPEQAVEAMVKSTTKGYLDATDATEEALRDIKAHEVAMVTGMEAALKGVLKRLDPAALEEKIQTGGGLGSLLKSKKARYWEIYETMFAEISDQAENDFHELFSREFARAYKDQLERLK